VDEAILHYEKALQVEPGCAAARYDLGDAALQQDRVDEAIRQFRAALQIKPDYPAARNNLGNALLRKGRVEEAITQYQSALQTEPDYPEAQNNLALVLATTSEAPLRNGPKAVALAARANQLSGGGDPLILRTLAAAYAETGRYEEAATTARRALDLAAAQKNDPLAATLRQEFKLYEADTPARDTK
jgi:tetratricopeptide (TPR) repeat protein